MYKIHNIVKASMSRAMTSCSCFVLNITWFFIFCNMSSVSYLLTSLHSLFQILEQALGVRERNQVILIARNFREVQEMLSSLAKVTYLPPAISSPLPSMTSKMRLGIFELIVFLVREDLDMSSKDG